MTKNIPNNTQKINLKNIQSKTPLPDIKTKKEFIQILSQRANFTQKDTEEFLDAFISIFEDATLHLSEIDLQGFVSLRHTRIESHKGSKPNRNGGYEEVVIPTSTRTTLSLSKSIKNLSKVDLDKLDDEE